RVHRDAAHAPGLNRPDDGRDDAVDLELDRRHVQELQALTPGLGRIGAEGPDLCIELSRILLERHVEAPLAAAYALEDELKRDGRLSRAAGAERERRPPARKPPGEYLVEPLDSGRHALRVDLVGGRSFRAEQARKYVETVQADPERVQAFDVGAAAELEDPEE